MSLLLKGGRIIDPVNGVDAVGDLLVREGRVAAIGPDLKPDGADLVPVKGLVVCPGLMDIHVHFRQPGFEHKETIQSGSRAAVMGGFVAVATEPNTRPAIDSPQHLAQLLAVARTDSLVALHPKACLTKAQRGEQVVAVAACRDAGAAALSDDGEPVLDAGIMRQALVEAKAAGLVVTPHCEGSPRLSGPLTMEPELVRRDIGLAAETGARIHFSHISTAAAVREIYAAQQQGLPITAEVTPHHLLLSADMVRAEDANAKMIPPLRKPGDVEVLRKALAANIISVIASDHAPHAAEEKALPYDEAPYGVIGLETTVGVVLSRLVRPHLLSLHDAIRRLSAGPARALGLPGGSLAVGEPANLTVLDLDKEWVVDPARFASMSRNCPFAGWKLRGRPEMTIIDGRVTMRGGEIIWTTWGF